MSKELKNQNDVSHLHSEAVRRLMRDWKEIESEPIPTISARPSPDNIFTWHCNLRPISGIYEGVIFHLELHFPKDYPHKPPSILLCDTIPHPNVFSRTFFCLNILRPMEYGKEYSGWSTAYTAQSILLQLESFLFAETMEQDGGYVRKQVTDRNQVDFAIRRINGFSCSCGHQYRRPFPALPKYDKEPNHKFSKLPSYKGVVKGKYTTTPAIDNRLIKMDSAAEFPPLPTMTYIEASPMANTLSSVTTALKQKTQIVETSRDYINEIPKEILLEIFSKLSFLDLSNLMRTCKSFSAVISDSAIFQRRELVCYHSKVSCDERVLGFGISADVTGPHTTNLRCALDLLSADAFHKENVRTGVWGEKFDYFLPIVINPNHGKRAENMMIDVIKTLAGRFQKPDFVNKIKVSGMTWSEHEDAAAILTVLPKLMNQMIVQILLDDENKANKKQINNRKFAIESSVSDRALLGYCTFHHMLLYLMKTRPYLKTIINEHVKRFKNADSYRDKVNIPDLGEFLVLVSLSEFSWLELAPTVLREVFTRNSRWVLRSSPELSKIRHYNDGIDYNRIEKSFENSKTSFRVLMFQVYFMVQLGTPSGKTKDEILERYYMSYGRPSESLKTALAKNTRDMLTVNTWPEFFNRVLVVCPSKATLTTLLINAQKSAMEKVGYHDSQYGSNSSNRPHQGGLRRNNRN